MHTHGIGNMVLSVTCVLLVALCAATTTNAGEENARPNFIIFFTDDQGFGDVGCFGATDIATPHLDKMAAEGIKLTSFYAQPVCAVSRAALLTGSHFMRVAEPGNVKRGHTELHPEEITLAEVLAQRGYVSACIGKWHLASRGGGRVTGQSPFPQELMPNAQGFDYFFGTPQHNGFTRQVNLNRHITELHRNGEIVEAPADMDTLTRRYTQESIAFMKQSVQQGKPFFLFLSHNMPHVPLGVSPEFRGKSERGLYGDVIMELDWSMGRVLATLDELGIDQNTFVIFTSDNGPWIAESIGDHGGSAGPLRGWKMSTEEGGPRVPAIVRWPGTIPAGRVSDEITTTMDLMPTFAALAGADLPSDRTLDGNNLMPLLSGQTDKGPNECFYYYGFTHLQAVRFDHWKLVLPRPASPPWCIWWGGYMQAIDELTLYDLQSDISERKNLADKHPELVERGLALIEQAREDLGDYDRIGRGARFFDDAPPRHESQRWIEQRRERGE